MRVCMRQILSALVVANSLSWSAGQAGTVHVKQVHARKQAVLLQSIHMQ